MLSLQTRIERTERLLRMLEQDAPLLTMRVAQLSPEHQESAKNYAATLMLHARAELERLLQHRTYWNSEDTIPHPAD
jgi:catechol-2,3-dioxygenase